MIRPRRRSPHATAMHNAKLADMVALHEAGLSIQEIAERYSVTKQAISGLLIRYGVRLSVLSAQRYALASAQKSASRIAAREQQSLIKWGCSYGQYLSLRCKPMRCFQEQRRNAGARGIGWELNLWEWWTIWQDSGHWPNRGRGQGYVMCRKGDEGPYAIGNVFIAPNIVNASNKPNKLSKLPIGVLDKGRRFLAKRMFEGRNHTLGLHGTSDQAHAAYLSLGPIGSDRS